MRVSYSKICVVSTFKDRDSVTSKFATQISRDPASLVPVTLRHGNFAPAFSSLVRDILMQKIDTLTDIYFSHSASGGTRTRTVLLLRDFKSLVSTIPPPRHNQQEAQTGFEPANISFANCRVKPLRHCAVLHSI